MTVPDAGGAPQLPGDYRRWEPVRRWASLADFLDGATLSNGTDIIALPSGDHLDVLFGGQETGPGRCVPVFFTGAMTKRAGLVPPFFSGVNLGGALGGRFVAFSDPLVAASSEVSLGWYVGRSGDDVQETVAAILELVHDRLGRELLLVGGSGGGFAALEQTRRARVPTSAFVWNPQTDIQRYIPRIVDTFLQHSFEIDASTLSRMSEQDRRERAEHHGMALSVVGRAPVSIGTGGRVLVLQNATDWHVSAHMGPYLDGAGLIDVGAGMWRREDEVWLVADLGKGHAVPPRAALELALEGMADSGARPSDVADVLRSRGLAPEPPPSSQAVDLRSNPASTLLPGDVRAIRDETGLVRVWHGTRSQRHASEVVELVTARGAAALGDRGRALVPSIARRLSIRLSDRLGHTLGEADLPVGSYSAGPGIAVIGSCVSRDALSHAPEGVAIVAYEARQSLASAFAPAVPVPPVVQSLSSGFQRRMLTSDHTKGLPDRLRVIAPSTDLLVWDLVDERLGVWVSETSVTTDSVEWRGLEAEGAAPPRGRHVPFGSEEHQGLFTASLGLWRELLEETGLLGRTVLLAPRWAQRTVSGDDPGLSFGLGAQEGNDATDRYLELVREHVGVPVIGRDVETRAGDDHRWGRAPFHFS